MIDLKEEERKTVTDILRKHAAGAQYIVVLFGSRASGRARRYSDVDIALVGDQAVPHRVLSTLDEAFEDSDLPYTVDVVDFASASQALKNQINTHGRELVRL